MCSKVVSKVIICILVLEPKKGVLNRFGDSETDRKKILKKRGKKSKVYVLCVCVCVFFSQKRREDFIEQKRDPCQ